ncbi:hypothetical protein N656DRAFT_391161 [Canariomyces notabilis]|uniref:Uncharacterized protein n=1 Tax=Canariomyces notabilis TaxID=2074819 RepID=A0AAN6TKD1_9PEZI|nr:hypothetical protein N656DRAFT_391161 [Canariomyces arenarius]
MFFVFVSCLMISPNPGGSQRPNGMGSAGVIILSDVVHVFRVGTRQGVFSSQRRVASSGQWSWMGGEMDEGKAMCMCISDFHLEMLQESDKAHLAMGEGKQRGTVEDTVPRSHCQGLKWMDVEFY